MRDFARRRRHAAKALPFQVQRLKQTVASAAVTVLRAVVLWIRDDPLRPGRLKAQARQRDKGDGGDR